MSDKPTGGPAFGKLVKVGEVTISEGGLTVRDWFAGQALKTLLTDFDYEKSTRCAYQIADLMIAERDK